MEGKSKLKHSQRLIEKDGVGKLSVEREKRFVEGATRHDCSSGMRRRCCEVNGLAVAW